MCSANKPISVPITAYVSCISQITVDPVYSEQQTKARYSL
jgi:hypothetical protein